MPTPEQLTPAGSRILASAEELFYARGITAVGVDSVALHSGVTKRTLYNQFGSKDHLVAQYLATRDERWRADVRAAVERCHDPVAAVLAPFDVLGAWSAHSARGCAFVNALAELPDADHPAHRIAWAQKRWLLGLFDDLADAAGCTRADARPDLAARLLALHEGVLVTRPLGLDVLASCRDLARSLVVEEAARS